MRQFDERVPVSPGQPSHVADHAQQQPGEDNVARPPLPEGQNGRGQTNRADDPHRPPYARAIPRRVEHRRGNCQHAHERDPVADQRRIQTLFFVAEDAHAEHEECPSGPRGCQHVVFQPRGGRRGISVSSWSKPLARRSPAPRRPTRAANWPAASATGTTRRPPRKAPGPSSRKHQRTRPSMMADRLAYPAAAIPASATTGRCQPPESLLAAGDTRPA